MLSRISFYVGDYMIIPITTNIHSEKPPYANYVFIIVLLISYILQTWFDPNFSAINNFLGIHTWLGYPTRIFIHANIFHLISNLIGLWIFGNVVCARMGNILYTILFVVFGAVINLLYFKITDNTVIGASGAINVVFGIFIYLFPFNRLKFLYFFIIANGRFYLQSLWVGLFWLYSDITGLFLRNDNIAHLAHLLGVILGLVIAHELTKHRVLPLQQGDKTILSLPDNLDSIDFNSRRTGGGIYAFIAAVTGIFGLIAGFQMLHSMPPYSMKEYAIGVFGLFLSQNFILYNGIFCSALILLSLAIKRHVMVLLSIALLLTLSVNLLFHAYLLFGLTRLLSLIVLLQIHQEEKFWPKKLLARTISLKNIKT